MIAKAGTPKHADGWLIHKAGRGWYRPDAAGYTQYHVEAGRYTYDDAMAHSHPNGLNGPRDGMWIKHESELPPPPKDARNDRTYTEAEAQALIVAALREAAELIARRGGTAMGDKSEAFRHSNAILALITTDASTALDRIVRDAEARGVERAADAIDADHRGDLPISIVSEQGNMLRRLAGQIRAGENRDS